MQVIVEIEPRCSDAELYIIPMLTSFFSDLYGDEKVFRSARTDTRMARIAIQGNANTPAGFERTIQAILKEDIGLRLVRGIGESGPAIKYAVIREPKKMTYGPFSEVPEEQRTDVRTDKTDAEEEVERRPRRKRKDIFSEPDLSGWQSILRSSGNQAGRSIQYSVSTDLSEFPSAEAGYTFHDETTVAVDPGLSGSSLLFEDAMSYGGLRGNEEMYVRTTTGDHSIRLSTDEQMNEWLHDEVISEDVYQEEMRRRRTADQTRVSSASQAIASEALRTTVAPERYRDFLRRMSNFEAYGVQPSGERLTQADIDET